MIVCVIYGVESIFSTIYEKEELKMVIGCLWYVYTSSAFRCAQLSLCFILLRCMLQLENLNMINGAILDRVTFENFR